MYGDCIGNSWILDSRCSQHMCPNRDWFIDYQSLDVGVVFMKNNMSCRVTSVGTVKIKMFDDRVTTLTDVRRVPDLKKNLVSLGTLDSQCYRYFAEGGVVRASKGAFMVIKGDLHNGFYFLQGSTVVGATAVSFCLDPNCRITRSWHLHSGHVSDVGVLVLTFVDDYDKVQFGESYGICEKKIVRHLTI